MAWIEFSCQDADYCKCQLCQQKRRIEKLEAECNRLVDTNDEWLKLKERFGWSFETAEEAEEVIQFGLKARLAELEAALARQPCVRRNDPFPPKSDEDCCCVTCAARIREKL